MKTAVRKTKRIKAALIVSLFLYVLATFCPTPGVGQNIERRARAESQLNYDVSYVMDDLSGMKIDGKEFKKTDYGFDVKEETRVVTLAEYCYSYDPERRGNYGLYVYVYNPRAIEFKDSPLNRITLCAGEDNRWKKYALDELSVCKDQDYEGMFYKYKLRLTDSERTEILNRVKSPGRVYEVSKIELLTSGTMNGTSYKVGSEYVYSGYSKGYGANDGAASTLTSTRYNFETLSLEVKATTYRPSGTNGKNEYT